MSPLVRKEIRLLLPFWGLAMLLAVLPSVLMPIAGYVMGIEPVIVQAFAFGLILLGLAPFGQEFSTGMFSSLLTQPIERRRIWKLKVLLITIAGLIVVIAFGFSIHARLDANAKEVMDHFGPANRLFPQQLATLHWRSDQFWPACGWAFLLLLIAITGGLWAALLFRQVGAALWFVILIPAALSVVVMAIFQSSPGHTLDIIMISVLGLYCAVGFVWAWRMFAGAQDSQWLGETVALLSLTSSKPRTESAAPRRRGAFRALIRKEFQSHQISLIIAFGLLVLHVCTLAYRKFGTIARSSELEFVVESVPFLWLIVPWLVGSVVVAEERKLGTMESQLCLPIARRFQFTIKLAVGLLLGVTLGAFAPVIIESIGGVFHIKSDLAIEGMLAHSYHVSVDTITFGVHRAFVLISLGAAFIFMASMYASSLTRNTLHALGAAILLGGGLSTLFQWVLFQSNRDYSLWRGPLIFVIGVPIVVIAVFWLSFSNYKILQPGRHVLLRNLLILAATLFFVGIGTAVVYQRPWELAMSLEPRHGAPRLSGNIEPTISVSMDRVFALLPDGRIWAGTDYREKEINEYEEVWDSQNQSNRLRQIKLYFPTSGSFVEGSNWVALVANSISTDIVALQSDGTLWNIISRENLTNRVPWLSQSPHPRRIGTDSDWKSVATGQRYFVAVKADGTLWGWGNSDGLFLDPRDRIPEPVRIGTDSDWALVFSRYSEPFFMKKDGSIFILNHNKALKSLFQKTYLNGKDWLAAVGSSDRNLVLKRDGTLWVSGYIPRVIFGASYDREGRNWSALTRIGDRSDWAQISGDYYFAAVRKDGSLVKNGTEWFSSTLGQPSRYSDWIAVDSSWSGILALSSDGTISLWRDIRMSEEPFLAPTHRPLWNLNILADSKN